MRSSSLLVFAILAAPALVVAQEEGYLDVVGPSGTMGRANYSEYGPAFEEFMSRSGPERNLSSYPEHLVDFLERGPQRTATNYSIYSPAFEAFINRRPLNLSRRGLINLSSYPDYLGRFLNGSSENLSGPLPNLSSYPDYLGSFLNGSSENLSRPLPNPSSYPDYLGSF